jgi:hypothetical protein
VYVDVAHALMVVYGVIFAKVVSEICGTRFPLDNKLVHINLVTDPVIVHFDGLKLLLFDVAIGNAYGALVVTDDQSSCLRVLNVDQGVTTPVALRPTKKSAAYSTSVADDITVLMMQLR